MANQNSWTEVRKLTKQKLIVEGASRGELISADLQLRGLQTAETVANFTGITRRMDSVLAGAGAFRLSARFLPPIPSVVIGIGTVLANEGLKTLSKRTSADKNGLRDPATLIQTGLSVSLSGYAFEGAVEMLSAGQNDLGVSLFAGLGGGSASFFLAETSDRLNRSSTTALETGINTLTGAK